MGKLTPRKIILFIAALIAFGFLLSSLSGCSSIRKLKTNVKQTEQVKTTEQITKAKDSSTTTTISKVDSSGTTVTVVFDNDGKDTATNVEIITHAPHKEDYYQPARTEVKTNRKPKSITVNQAAKNKQQQETTAVVKTKETKAVTTDKTTTTKVKQLDKKKSGFAWWFWPLIVLVIIVIVLCWAYKITPATAWAWVRKQFNKTTS